MRLTRVGRRHPLHLRDALAHPRRGQIAQKVAADRRVGPFSPEEVTFRDRQAIATQL